MSRASLRSDPRLRGRGRHRSPWTPRRLAPRAWYDAELGQPKYVGYVQLNGGSTDNISVPDTAFNSFSNDIEVIMRVRPDDWTTGSIQTLCGKYLTTGNQRSWRFYISATGTIGLTASVDGTAVTTVLVTPTTPFVDATWIWLRLRLDLTNGVNSVGTIDTAADTGNNYTIPTSWTANGTNTGTTLAGVFNSTALVEIGSFNSGTSERLAGRVGRCIVKAGFDGTITSDFNADDCYGPGYVHADGYYWTLGIPKIYDRSGNNVAPAVFGSGTNQPLWLPWADDLEVYVPGAVNNFISTPHAATMSPVTSLRATIRITLDSLTGGGVTRELFSKWTGNFTLAINTSDQFRYLFSDAAGATSTITDDGTTLANLGIIPNKPFWVRVTHLLSGTVTIEYSLEDVDTVPSTWINAVTNAVTATAALGNANSAIALMARSGGATGNTAGNVLYALLEVDGTSVAEFNPAQCGQSGYTGSLGNVWTVNRATAGRKTVVQSGAAKSARSIILLGTDDWIDVPVAAVPALDTFAAASSVIAAFRRWHNPGAVGHAIFTTKASSGNVVAGTSMRMNTTATSPIIAVYAGDGTNLDGVETSTNAPVLGLRAIHQAIVGSASPFVNARSNGQANGADTSRTTTGTTSTGGAGRIGAYLGGTGAIDMEFEGLITLDDAVSAIEHSRAVEYYNGGL